MHRPQWASPFREERGGKPVIRATIDYAVTRRDSPGLDPFVFQREIVLGSVPAFPKGVADQESKFFASDTERSIT